MSLNVTLGTFRQEIKATYREIRVGWGECSGDYDRIQWFKKVLPKIDKVKHLKCDNACRADIMAQDNLIKIFDDHAEQHWCFSQLARDESNENG